MATGEGAAKDIPVNGADMYMAGLRHEALSTRQPDVIRHSDVSDRELNGHDLIAGSDAYDPAATAAVEMTIRRFRQPQTSGRPLGTLSLNSAISYQGSKRF